MHKILPQIDRRHRQDPAECAMIIYAWNKHPLETAMKTGSMIAIIIFVIVAILHLLRVISGTPVVVGGMDTPVWISYLGTVVPLLVAWLLWKEAG